MKNKPLKLGVIGAGVMGQALVRGLLKAQKTQAENIWAAARTETTCQRITESMGIKAYTDYKAVLPETDVLLLCVKPKSTVKVLETLRKYNLSEKTILISIVAGTPIALLESTLAQKNPVIRAMPNTPAIVGQGMTVLCGGEHVTPEALELAHSIFHAVGETLELEESHFDAVTGLGGSGPAYIYLMMEALADGGVRVGLPREVALKIVTQTVLGAAYMIQQTGRHPASLRDDVTTPAGCTIGGLLIMEDGKIRSVLARAVEEATRIASQLGEAK